MAALPHTSPRRRARRMGLYASEAATSLAAKERYAATLLADDALLLRQFAACFDDAEVRDSVLKLT